MIHISFLLITPVCFFTQNNNLRQKIFILDKDTLEMDSLSLDPFSIQFTHPGDSLYCKIDPIRKYLIRTRTDTILKISITYRVFPIDFNKNYFHKDLRKLERDLTRPENPINLVFDKDNTKQRPNFLEQDGLTKNGSISRGILFGNNQDVVVNSGLNLQLGGRLTKDIQISLAATDNNIPIQPEGNTQQLQEFDKVYIQLNDEHSKLIAGDFQLERPKSYFMNFYKRLQGALVSNHSEIQKGGKVAGSISTTVSAAVSRGRFSRNVIQGMENNQGPYRLKGADLENFIIVLSGTEKVFIDGKLLVRGQENDYVMDYNNAEISFTAKNIITKDKRIIVEFQYAERNYSRALYYASSEWSSSNSRIFFNFYQESDNKNKTLMQELSLTDKQLLSLIGDSLQNAVIPGDQISEFNSMEVFYRKTDTVVNSVNYSGIFIYNTSPDSISYRVRFSQVGSGKGNYIQSQSSANGRVYSWVAPLDGIPQGDHEPVTQLVTPKEKRMITAGVENLIGKNGKIFLEGVLSLEDINTFSSFDSNDDNGQGLKFNVSNSHILRNADSTGRRKLEINYSGGYEFVQTNFSQLERFRTAEFDRDWNRNLSGPINNDQHIINASFGFTSGKIWTGNYYVNSFLEGNQYNGVKHSFSNSIKTETVRLNYNSSLLNTRDNEKHTQFYRHKSNASLKIKSVQLNFSDELEHNIFRNEYFISSQSYQFWEWETSLTSVDTSNNYFKLFYKKRKDLKAYSQILSDSAFAQNAGLQFQFNQNRNHVFRSSFTLREMEFQGPNFLNSKPDNNFLGRLEYFPKILRGFLQSNVFFESGYGLELRREFSYIQVAAGQGQYFWNDYNGNGIKELNEFELAQFPDQAIYIRIWTPTSNYVRVNRDQFSYSMTLRPSVFSKSNSGGGIKFLSRLVTQTVYRIDRKTQSDMGWERFNFLWVDTKDSLLTGMNYNFRQALFFNQSDPVFGFDFTYTDNRNKQLLTNGFETRIAESSELKFRWNITREWGLFINSGMGTKVNLSEFFSSRNYRIKAYENEVRLAFQPSTALKLSFSVKHTNKENPGVPFNLVANFQDLGTELKFNKLGKGSITAKFNYIGIESNSIQNTPVAFEMLNSLKPGKNFTWSLNYQQNLNNNLQISITYDARKSPENKVIHIGGAQVRAFF